MSYGKLVPARFADEQDRYPTALLCRAFRAMNDGIAPTSDDERLYCGECGHVLSASSGSSLFQCNNPNFFERSA
jgi:hypothetical protein